MRNRWRLDSKAPALADIFRNSTPEKQRRAAVVACEAALFIVGLNGAEADEALRALRDGRLGNASLRERLTALSARLDDEYFRVNEECEASKKPEALALFARARAASALAFSLSDDSTQLHEAIYEAMSAVSDDPSEVARVASAALQTTVPS
jgi:hypothetical protein